VAKNLFPNKVFKHSFINAKSYNEVYDVVTCLFYLHTVPQYMRSKIIKSAIEIATERVVILDVSPEYTMEGETLEINIDDYIDNCRDDLKMFREIVLMDGLLNIWVLNKNEYTDHVDYINKANVEEKK